MKRCPECRRDYYDDSLAYCLEDGAALIQGSVPSPDEPATEIVGLPIEPQTRMLPTSVDVKDEERVSLPTRNSDARVQDIYRLVGYTMLAKGEVIDFAVRTQYFLFARVRNRQFFKVSTFIYDKNTARFSLVLFTCWATARANRPERCR